MCFDSLCVNTFATMAEEEKVVIVYRSYGSWEELGSKEVRLLRDAAQAASHAYAPYSNFRVGAAVRMASGRIVLGNNQENASYPAGCCAERTALHAAMATNPNDEVDAIATKRYDAQTGADRFHLGGKSLGPQPGFVKGLPGDGA